MLEPFLRVPQNEVGKRSSITLFRFLGALSVTFWSLVLMLLSLFSSLFCPNSFCRIPFAAGIFSSRTATRIGTLPANRVKGIARNCNHHHGGSNAKGLTHQTSDFVFPLQPPPPPPSRQSPRPSHPKELHCGPFRVRFDVAVKPPSMMQCQDPPQDNINRCSYQTTIDALPKRIPIDVAVRPLSTREPIDVGVRSGLFRVRFGVLGGVGVGSGRGASVREKNVTTPDARSPGNISAARIAMLRCPCKFEFGIGNELFLNWAVTWGCAKRMGGGKRTRERALPKFLDPSQGASVLLCCGFLYTKDRALTPERGGKRTLRGWSKTPFWKGCHSRGVPPPSFFHPPCGALCLKVPMRNFEIAKEGFASPGTSRVAFHKKLCFEVKRFRGHFNLQACHPKETPWGQRCKGQKHVTGGSNPPL